MDQRQSPLAYVSGVVMTVLSGLPIANGTAQAQSVGSGHARPHSLGVAKPRIDLTQPADSTDLTQQLSHDLNGVYDQYLASKTNIQNDYNIQFWMSVSVFGQWGTPNRGPSVAELVYSPAVTWTPFTNTAIGSGAFNFAFQGNQFWTGANTNSQQGSMGLITAPNDWGANGYQYGQITYTQTLPGKWLAVSAGQYSFGQYGGNQYAGNAQANFINYALAQNATQTYANAGMGAYAQINPNSQLQFAGGLQGATNITGETVTVSGFRNNQIAYFLNAQWTPSFLAGGTYSILYYDQPSVPQQPSESQGVSFSAVQNLNATYGLFLRVNNASGDAIPIETSVAFGGIVHNPFGRNRLDQAGIGVAWDQTNQAAVGAPARGSEWVSELYYSYTVFKALQLTPDLQVYFNPALAPNTSVAAVFSLGATLNF
jgi:hypothetical protein